MSLVEILVYMRKNPKPIFTLSELAEALKMNKATLAVALNRLTRKGLVDKGLRGLYLNPFANYSDLEVALTYKSPSYVSMEFALSGSIFKQNYYTYTIVTTRKVTTSRPMRIGKTLVEYHQISPCLFFGYRLGRYALSTVEPIPFAEPEKAVLDIIYFRYFKGPYTLEDLLSVLDDMFLEELDKNKLFDYARRFGPRMLSFVKRLDKEGWWEHSPER